MANKNRTTVDISDLGLDGALDLDDLFSPHQTSPLAKVEPKHDEPHHHGSDPVASPELRRASADQTRAATAGMTASDHMRDLLNRIQPGQDDEIDDREAARRAGLHGEPEPRPPGQDVTVRRADVPAVISNALRAAGVQNPAWHTINHLPGYMNRNTRGMGRDLFSMFTRTPLEDIMTIANVYGQGPNTTAEIHAVVGWLKANAEDMGPTRLNHAIAIPGYHPEVREYRTKGIRFHVVLEPNPHADPNEEPDPEREGRYVYAYPEQDAVTHGAHRGLTGGQRRLGGPEHNESKEMKMSLSEEIRRNMRLLENIEQDHKFDTEIDALLEELEIIEANKWARQRASSPTQSPEVKAQRQAGAKERAIKKSSIAELIGNVPGGKYLIRWLHKEAGLGSTADYGRDYAQGDNPPNTRGYGSGIEYDQVTKARVMWKTIKNHPDQFVVIIGDQGCAALLPKPGYHEGEAARRQAAYDEKNAKKIAKGQPVEPFEPYGPEQAAEDTKLIYQYATFTNNGLAYWAPEVDNEGNILARGETKKRGGIVWRSDREAGRGDNIMDSLKDIIGTIKTAWAIRMPEHEPEWYGAPGQPREKEKRAWRAANKAPLNKGQMAANIAQRLVAIQGPLIAQISGDLSASGKQFIDAGNTEMASKFAQLQKELNDWVVATKTSGKPILTGSIKDKFFAALKSAYEKVGSQTMTFDEFLQTAGTPGKEGLPLMKPIMAEFRKMLITPHAAG
jgi:hypothetical protein